MYGRGTFFFEIKFGKALRIESTGMAKPMPSPNKARILIMPITSPSSFNLTIRWLAMAMYLWNRMANCVWDVYISLVYKYPKIQIISGYARLKQMDRSIGPPLLPWLTAASVWMSGCLIQSKPVSPVDLSSEDTIPSVHVFCKPKGLPRLKGHVEGITQDFKIFNEDIDNDNDDNNHHNNSNSGHSFPANKKEGKFHKASVVLLCAVSSCLPHSHFVHGKIVVGLLLRLRNCKMSLTSGLKSFKWAAKDNGPVTCLDSFAVAQRHCGQGQLWFLFHSQCCQVNHLILSCLVFNCALRFKSFWRHTLKARIWGSLYPYLLVLSTSRCGGKLCGKILSNATIGTSQIQL